MNKINKHNVEAHYLDFLEGNLSVEDTDLLMAFIDSNPEFSDLFDDTDDLLSLQLKPSDDKFGDTEELKTIPCKGDEVCLANIDFWLVAKAENTLSVEELQRVNDFVIENSLEINEAYVSAAYLKPDLSESFGDLAVLKKDGGTIIPLLMRVASIAAIFLFIWLVWNPKKSIEQQYVSRDNIIQKIDEVKYISPDVMHENNLATVEKIEQPTQRTLKTDTFSKKTNKDSQKPKTFTDFLLLNQSIKNINVAVTYAMQNPPKMVSEDLNLSAIFYDYEQTIAKNESGNSSNLAQVNIAKPKYELEEQYKPVTQRLSNLTSLDMSIKKMPEEADISQTVIQIGKFSFERKKKK
ncbi:MAG: hypothetical protein AB8B72_03120 [Crocinitomicaceae bacterium]